MSKALQDPTDLTDRRGSEGSEEQIETDPLATVLCCLYNKYKIETVGCCVLYGVFG